MMRHFGFTALAALLVLGLLPSAAGGQELPEAEPEPAATASARALVAAACLLGASELDHALLPATRGDALPEGYAPPDLVPLASTGVPQRGSQQLRSAVIPDALDMIEAAQSDGVALFVSSGYRSYAVQVSTYRYWVGLRGPEAADRVSARPGHSQHQLGTAIDFNFGSLGGFAASPAGLWLWDHAHEYGFVFPYTLAATARSGYIFEPWHVRWVGRELSTLMWQEGYQGSETLTADDYVALARAVVPSSNADPVLACAGVLSTT